MKTDLIDKSHFFYQKKVVITGIFNNYPIREKAGPKKLEQISSFNIKTITEEEFINIFPYEKQ